MQNVIRWHDIIVQNPRLFKPAVNLALTQFKYLRELAYAVCYKFKSLSIYLTSL